MSMVRDPLFRVGEPAHNLIPSAGGAVWYPLHDSLLAAGIADLPALAELGTPSGAKWGTSGMYTLPEANTDCALNAVEDEDDLFLSSHLSLYPATLDAHYIIALDASYVAAPSGNSALWSWGKDTGTASLLGLDITSGELPRFNARGKDSSATTNQSLTAQSGTFAAFRNQGIFSLVLGVRMVSASAVDVELRLGNGTLSAHYAASNVDVLNAGTGGTAVPGISGGVTMGNFGGLYLGCKGAASPTNFWGRGAGNTGAVGNFSARRFPTYSASRVADALAFMVARKRDFPRSLSSDYV